MKKKFLVYIILSITVFSLSACSSEPMGTVLPDSTPATENDSAASSTDTAAEMSQEPVGTVLTDSTPTTENDSAASSTDTAAEMSQEEPSPPTQQNPRIIWIGDSLTQGSLGEDNHNENNPQAPWRVLGEISGIYVAGAGFYGYSTHDIFRAYKKYNGLIDPEITYVYWVGSNDCFESPENVKYVIEETDRFNEENGITNYIMLGTTDRHDMPSDYTTYFNEALSDHYGDRYLDILPYVEYGPDGVHLTEESYAAVARAVYERVNGDGSY